MTTGKTEVIRDQPDQEYRLRDAVSQSVLKLYYGVSPAEARYKELNPKASTDPMIMGIGLSELNKFERLVEVGLYPEGDGRKPEVANARKLAAAQYKYLLGAADMRHLLAGWERLSSFEPYQKLCSAPDIDKELSFYWPMGNHNVACKGRADLYSECVAILADIKFTSQELSDRNLEKLIPNSLWHGQLAWYRLGLRACGLPVDQCLLFIVASYPPYEVRCISLEDADLFAGERKMLELLELYDRCRRLKCWPGYGNGVDRLLLPAWVRE